MTNKRKILYVEDMEKCYEKTKGAIGNHFDIDWKDNYTDAENSIIKDLHKYSAGIFDVNLSDNLQSTEGIELIKLARKEAEARNIHFPILCVSSNGKYKEISIENGADLFFWKKQFWKNGKNILEDLIGKA